MANISGIVKSVRKIMRRFGICEEKSSGVDCVVEASEMLKHITMA